MDRKGIIIVVLCVAALVWWQLDNTKRTAAARAEKERAEELAKQEAAKVPVVPVTPEAPAVPGAPVQAEAPVAEKLEKVATPAVDYTLTNLGGGIRRAVLREHLAEHGAKVEMNQFAQHAIGELTEAPGKEAPQAFTKEEGNAESDVTFVRTDARQVQIRKTFKLPRAGAGANEYVTQLEVSFKNVGPNPISLPAYYVYTGSAAPIHQIDQAQYIGYAWMPGGKFTMKNVGTFSKGGFLWTAKEIIPIFQEEHPDTNWAGVTNQYFSSIVVPLETKGIAGWAHRFEIDKSLIGTSGEAPATPVAAAAPNVPVPKVEALDGALGMPGLTLAPGAEQVVKFQLYTGPRQYKRLKALGHREDEIMEFGMFHYVSKALLWSMNQLHDRLGSYAIAIIVLTIIIRGLMWPLQNKATRSMKRMQALTPMMNDLKAKYKDDPARMNQELMKLYKEYQINPLAGCLPMVVQIPVFFGFFNMLGKAVELRGAGAPFLPWVHDLSQMDTVWTIPIIHEPLNILPLFMAVTMFWQMSLSPKSGDAVQQRVFMFMPLIFIFFCYKYASALALYWTVQNIFSIVQLYLTRNQTAPVLQKVPASSKKLAASFKKR
ncbi:MAG TPA: membrane protein insertase YidC [Chthoniobacteraceae bacterium]|jgi:YidC/Oxa1 family membrane protein insertase|nr:membrane protein insertase YidC [Chthoniobacteraceae bacterium]